jgi:hypothetical protein
VSLVVSKQSTGEGNGGIGFPSLSVWIPHTLDSSRKPKFGRSSSFLAVKKSEL